MLVAVQYNPSRDRFIMEQFKESAQKMLEIQKKIKFLKEEENKLSVRLKIICDNETTSFAGFTFKKFDRLGPVKYKDIPELKSVDLDAYRAGMVTMWKLSYQEQFEELLEV